MKNTENSTRGGYIAKLRKRVSYFSEKLREWAERGGNGGLQSRIHDNIFMLSRITTRNSKNSNFPQIVAIQSRYIHDGFITFHDCIFDQIHDHDRQICQSR